MRGLWFSPVKHLGLDGECPADMADNPVKARPLSLGGAAQAFTAKSGDSHRTSKCSPCQGEGASASEGAEAFYGDAGKAT